MSEVHDPWMGENWPQKETTNGGGVCVWDKTGFKVTVRIQCKNELYPHDDALFRFCPFCGKKIEIKK
jgi:hypothetical protein